jgi:hypothetical protein
MFANHPDIAKRWEKEFHQQIGKLPEHVKKHPVKRKKNKKPSY